MPFDSGSGSDGGGGGFPTGSLPGGGGGGGFGGGGDTGDTEDPVVSNAVAIPVAGTSFTLAWDAATGDVDEYEVFFRDHGSDEWVLLGTADAVADPTFDVTDSILAYGNYDFAVRAVLIDGNTTEYHTSLDSTADPNDGWYIEWTEV
jgi:hypothetical protein